MELDDLIEIRKTWDHLASAIGSLEAIDRDERLRWCLETTLITLHAICDDVEFKEREAERSLKSRGLLE